MDREARAMVARLRRQREFEAWGIWTSAQLTRVDPKKFPKLDDFLRLARGEKKRARSQEDLIADAYRTHELTKRKS